AHDGGPKQVLGKVGAFTGEDVVALVARAPASARHLARAWLEAFVHPAPEAHEVQPLAGEYERQERRVGKTLRTLFSSELFFSERAYRSLVRGPLEVAVGLVRSVGGRVVPAALARAIGKMGQVLLEPPSVEGWPRQGAWLNPSTW